MESVGFNIVGLAPWSTIYTNEFVTATMKMGYNWFSIMPFLLTNTSAKTLQNARYVEGPFGTGNPWDVFYGNVIKRNLKAPKTHDLIFPWKESIWQRMHLQYVQAGIQPIVHTFDESGLVEISPRLRMHGTTVTLKALKDERRLVFDTTHAERDLRLDELNNNEQTTSALGPWQKWLPYAIQSQTIALIDFHPSPTDCANRNWTPTLQKLQFALDKGYKGPIRVELQLPLWDQLWVLNALTAAEEVLQIIKRL